jgi:predicted kinase
MRNKVTHLVLLCGLPRSGKSTWVKNNKKDAIVVSLDEIRKEIFGHQFHGPSEYFVMGIAKSMVRLLLAQHKSVIVDATNVRRQWRAEWENLAEERSAKCAIICFKTPLEVCLKRNEVCPENEQVPVDVLVSMNERFELENPISYPDMDSTGREIPTTEIDHYRD